MMPDAVACVAAVMGGYWGRHLSQRGVAVSPRQVTQFVLGLQQRIVQELRAFRVPLQADFAVGTDYAPDLTLVQAADAVGVRAAAVFPRKTACRYREGQVYAYDREAPVWQTGEVLYVLLAARVLYEAEAAAWVRRRAEDRPV